VLLYFYEGIGISVIVLVQLDNLLVHLVLSQQFLIENGPLLNRFNSSLSWGKGTSSSSESQKE